LINLPLNLALEKGAKQSPLDLFAGTPSMVIKTGAPPDYGTITISFYLS
jgi:hypothetical protein